MSPDLIQLIKFKFLIYVVSSIQKTKLSHKLIAVVMRIVEVKTANAELYILSVILKFKL